MLEEVFLSLSSKSIFSFTRETFFFLKTVDNLISCVKLCGMRKMFVLLLSKCLKLSGTKSFTFLHLDISLVSCVKKKIILEKKKSLSNFQVFHV